jgi:SagB-type dehydrogenase family enzyme
LGEERGAAQGHGHAAVHAPVPEPWQKSRRVRIPETLRELHQLTMLDGCALASLVEGRPADQWATPPETGMVERSLRCALPAVLRARRSAWGSLYSAQPIGRGQLMELLSFAWRRAGPEHAPLREALPEAGLGLVVQAIRAGDVPCGAYRFDPRENTLIPIECTPFERWQLSYSMTNYNIDEAGCILFVTGNLEAAMQHYGARGYRLLNMYVGMLAQLVYVGASALRLDCGVVLGVRAQHVKRSLRLPDDENVCLAAYISQPQQQVYQFSHSLMPDVPDWREMHG